LKILKIVLNIVLVLKNHGLEWKNFQLNFDEHLIDQSVQLIVPIRLFRHPSHYQFLLGIYNYLLLRNQPLSKRVNNIILANTYISFSDDTISDCLLNSSDPFA